MVQEFSVICKVFQVALNVVMEFVSISIFLNSVRLKEQQQRKPEENRRKIRKKISKMANFAIHKMVNKCKILKITFNIHSLNTPPKKTRMRRIG